MGSNAKQRWSRKWALFIKKVYDPFKKNTILVQFSGKSEKKIFNTEKFFSYHFTDTQTDKVLRHEINAAWN